MSGLSIAGSTTVQDVVVLHKSLEVSCSGESIQALVNVENEWRADFWRAWNSCQVCDVSLCEDCLGDEEIEAVGDTLPEFLVLGYGKRAQAYYM